MIQWHYFLWQLSLVTSCRLALLINSLIISVYKEQCVVCNICLGAEGNGLQVFKYTYLLTPWNRVLLEKLTSKTIQEIPRIYGTRKFLTVPTSDRHPSLSWANSIQSPRRPPTSWRSTLILSSHLRLGLPNGLFPSGFPTNRSLNIVTKNLKAWTPTHGTMKHRRTLRLPALTQSVLIEV